MARPGKELPVPLLRVAPACRTGSAHPLVSQCTVIGEGCPYIGCRVTLDLEALVCWKQQHGRPVVAPPATSPMTQG
jgi:hypothetical protein